MEQLSADNLHPNDSFGAERTAMNAQLAGKYDKSVYERYDKFDLKAIDLVRTEKIYYEFSTVQIRRNIKKARQYYAGVFDNPKTTTGREKIFIPMTQWEVDAIVSKLHVNEKSLTLAPNNEQSIFPAFIMDKVVKYQMHVTRFPMYFKNSQYDLAIDGTIVFASFWNFERQVIDEEKKANKGIIDGLKNLFKKLVGKNQQTIDILKDQIGFKQVDVLNCFIDPTADSIQDAISFIFRDVQPLEKIQRNKLYTDSKGVNRAMVMTGYTVERPDFYDARSVRVYELGQNFVRYEQPMGAVYARWGRFPKSFLTKKDKDDGIMIDGVISIGDLDTGAPVLLRIEVNPFAHGKKPFEECWFQKKQGKWYGLGPALKMLGLQEYLNKSVNRRVENEDVLHAGIFKIKRGSGISAKSIISQPGALLEVENMNDIEQMATSDISSLSNGTLDMIQQFVEKINGTSSFALGLQNTRSATVGMIQNQNADMPFQQTRDYINDFLVRFFDQWVKNDQQFLDQPFVMRVTGEEMEFRHIDTMLNIKDNMKTDLPPYRFINVDPKSIKGSFDIVADIDASVPKDNGEMAAKVLQAMQAGKQMQLNAPYDQLFNKYLDLIGLTGISYKALAGNQPVTPTVENTPVQPQINSGQPSVANVRPVHSPAPSNGTTIAPSILKIAENVRGRSKKIK